MSPMTMGHNPIGQGPPGMGIGVQGNNPQMQHGLGSYGPNPGKLPMKSS